MRHDQDVLAVAEARRDVLGEERKRRPHHRRDAVLAEGEIERGEFERVDGLREQLSEELEEVLEIVKDFEVMDASAFWQDLKFSLRHLKDFSRCAIIANPNTRHLWSSLVAPFMSCEVEHFAPGEEDAARDWLMWPEGAADV